MRNKILFILLLTLNMGFSQDSIQTEKIYSLGNLEKNIKINSDWKAKIGNDSLWREKDYDDSNWNGQTTVFYKIKDSLYQGEMWFRNNFEIDSSLVNVPIALNVASKGNAVVFLNSEYLGKFGRADNILDFKNEKNRPVVFAFKKAGEQVLTVQYTDSLYSQSQMMGQNGFSLKLTTTEKYIEKSDIDHYLWLATTSIGIIFITLGIIHFILFGFYRKFIANLFFGVFNLCSGISFLFGYSKMFLTGMDGVLFSDLMPFSSIIASLIGGLAISGTVNFLFSKSRIRFYIFTGLVALSLLLVFFVSRNFAFISSLLTSVMFLEAIIVVLLSALNKKPGSRIILTGLIFNFGFALLLGVSVGIAIPAFGGVENFSFAFWGVITVLATLSFFSTPFAMSAYLASTFASVSRKLNKQLEQVNELSQQALKQEQEKKEILENKKHFLETEVKERTKEIEIQKQQIQQQQTELLSEKQKSEDLLLNILPKDVADELKENGESRVKQFDNVSILFSDFTNLDSVSKQLDSQELLDELNYCFQAFDNITTKHQVEKIKTIGYSYMAVSGLPLENENHAKKMIEVALEMCAFISEYQAERKKSGKPYFEIKIGINSGEVVAGIVGIKKFAYDIWGDAVNTAARMRGKSENGKINVSHTTYDLAKDYYDFSYRGELEIKGKGMAKMYFVETKTN